MVSSVHGAPPSLALLTKTLCDCLVPVVWSGRVLSSTACHPAWGVRLVVVAGRPGGGPLRGQQGCVNPGQASLQPGEAASGVGEPGRAVDAARRAAERTRWGGTAVGTGCGLAAGGRRRCLGQHPARRRQRAHGLGSAGASPTPAVGAAPPQCDCLARSACSACFLCVRQAQPVGSSLPPDGRTHCARCTARARGGRRLRDGRRFDNPGLRLPLLGAEG